MKRVNKLFLLFVVVLGLTGCSFGSSKDKEKPKKKTEPVIKDDEPLKADASLFNMVGSYKKGDINLDIYVYALSDDLMVEINMPEASEDGTVGIYSLEFPVEFTDDKMQFELDFIDLKGTIETNDNKLNIILESSSEEDKVIAGEYEKIEDVGGIRGYYVGGRTTIAITPLADKVYVSTHYEVKDDSITFETGSLQYCKYVSDEEISCEEEDEDEDDETVRVLTITKTSDGLEVNAVGDKLEKNYKAVE